MANEHNLPQRHRQAARSAAPTIEVEFPSTIAPGYRLTLAWIHIWCFYLCN